MKIYFDGGCRPNPGAMEVAVVVRGALYHEAELGSGSSELAEWLALLRALKVARALEIRDPLLLGDSAAVIDQAMSGARCRSPEACACRARFEDERRWFDRVRVRRIRRNQNLAGIALGQLRQGRRIAGGSNGPPGAMR